MRPISNLQYPLLKHFARNVLRMHLEEAHKYRQGTLGSLIRRGWVVWSGGGFHLTKEGRDAWETFNHSSVLRKDPSRPLTAYFDPTAYGLKDPQVKRRGLRIVHRGVA